ncbi:hypothetical protein GOV13_05285 [Candidatus Pacearchaeota archaeon]|nr:hypothetical protein [Candidatus Pacearchaeota archaeon]
MKTIKTILIALILINCVLSVSAITGVQFVDSFWDDSNSLAVTGVQEVIYKCSDSACSSQGSLITSVNSGGSNQITIEFPYNPSSTENNQDYYAHFTFKDGYLPMEYIDNIWGYGVTNNYNYRLLKETSCQAPIDSFSVTNQNFANEPVVINMVAELGANTDSAFTDLRIPWFPVGYADHYSVETRVTLEVLDGSDNVVYTDTEDLNILMDTTENAQFVWTPTTQGNYRARVRTDVIDSQCSQSNTVQDTSSKDFVVLPNRPQDECYTILNNLETEQSGTTFKILFDKISNYASDAFVKTAVPTRLAYQIADGPILLYTNNILLSANSNTVDPQAIEIDWTPPYDENFEVQITGVAESAFCSGVANPAETATLSFFAVESDTVIYSTTFLIRDSITGNPIEDAVVNFGALNGLTDSLGRMVFETEAGVYVWGVGALGYINGTGILIVNSNQTLSVQMTAAILDNDGDGFGSDVDCNDNNANVWQNLAGYTDADGDNFGVGAVQQVCSGLNLPTGFTNNSVVDCDDTDVAVNPDATEICGDEIDNNCNDETDEAPCSVDNDGDGFAEDIDCNDNNDSIWQNITGYTDVDGDGIGVGAGQQICSGLNLPSGFTDNAGPDCDDNNVNAWQNLTGYTDADGDGFGFGAAQQVCSGASLPTGFTDNPVADCNDTDVNVNPGAPEICGDEIDNDCDDEIDETPCSVDNDGDGVAESLDCNDNDEDVWQNLIGYTDNDGDGFGVGNQINICSGASLPPGYTNNPANDCDDTDANISPGAEEIDGDGIDNNCNRVIDESGIDDDQDGDGIPDIDDPDADGDGVMDSPFGNVDPDGDIDNDGIPNIDDQDMDGDGIPNGVDPDAEGDDVIDDAVCGNWVLEDIEQCDDGNSINGDGCSNVCLVEAGDGGDDDDDDGGTSSSGKSSRKCSPDWKCSDWSECTNGMKTKSCTDLNFCGDSSSKPIEATECGGGFITGFSTIGLRSKIEAFDVEEFVKSPPFIVGVGAVLILLMLSLFLPRRI